MWVTSDTKQDDVFRGRQQTLELIQSNSVVVERVLAAHFSFFIQFFPMVSAEKNMEKG